jgi:hypothetical protein
MEGTWSETFSFERGAFVAVSAQNLTEGRVACTITVDGKVLSRNESFGFAKIADCSGSAD